MVTEKIKKEIIGLVETAISVLLLDYSPRMAHIVLPLEIQPTNKVPAAATDGTAVYYNPEFTKKLTQKELIGVSAHEACHCASGHSWRFTAEKGYEHKKINIACDEVINKEIKRQGFT